MIPYSGLASCRTCCLKVTDGKESGNTRGRDADEKILPWKMYSILIACLLHLGHLPTDIPASANYLVRTPTLK